MLGLAAYIALLVICLYAAAQKSVDPSYTFGGEQYRTRRCATAFYFALAALIVISRRYP